MSPANWKLENFEGGNVTQDELAQYLEIARSTTRVWLPSRVIRSVGYFPPTQMLEVEQRGRDYRKILQFFGVPPNVLEDLVQAPSAAAYFYQKLHGVYPTQTVERAHSAFREPPWRQGERSEAQAWGWL